jgi:ElaA protein
MNDITWVERTFEDLSVHQLYDVMNLRQEVFLIEQNTSYLDADNVDQDSFHLLAYIGSNLQGYSRLIPPGIKYQDASIGRVVLHKKFRGSGLSKILMDKSIHKCKVLYPDTDIRISAQYPLVDFYQGYGFKTVGKIYDEDGIPHIEMVLEK